MRQPWKCSTTVLRGCFRFTAMSASQAKSVATSGQFSRSEGRDAHGRSARIRFA
jgi:hypothetical protein